MVGLTWLGQAGFLVEGNSGRFLFDPFLSEVPDRLVAPPVSVDDLPVVAAAFVSHGHLDHFDPPTLAALRAAQPGLPVVLPESVDGGLGLEPCRAGDELQVAGLEAHVVPAMHGVEPSDAYRFGPFHGYVVELDGVRIYHAGDTLAWDGLASLLRELRVDVALLPINGRDAQREAGGIVGNMDHREAVRLAADAGCRTLVPMHYGMFASNTVDPDGAVAHAREAHPVLDVRLPILGQRLEV